MASAGGYVFKVPSDRAELFTQCFRRDEQFSQPVAEFNHTRGAPLICFIVLDGTHISYIARGRKGLVAGTALRRLNVEEPAKLECPIPISSVIASADSRFSNRIASIFERGGMVTPKTFEEIVDVISDLSEEAKQLLLRFSRHRAELLSKLGERVKENLAEQKEAVAMAMAIAGIDRAEILEWSPPSESSPSSFLDGLPSAVMREDPMITNDLINVPGFNVLRTLPYSAVVFENDETRLTVISTNRTPLETLLGTDLIYFNETYRSFVMVQYKAMEHGGDQASFRLPNSQLEKELERMDIMEAQLNPIVSSDLDDYRLNEKPFYLKLCARMNFNPDDIKLFPGMYFPLAQWRLIEKSPTIAGSRGGKAVSYGNVGRYIDNNFFITAVASAWIGTNSKQSNLLEGLVRTTLESGKAIVLAVKSNAPHEE